jgi:predicted nicotinamide N-methyase
VEIKFTHSTEAAQRFDRLYQLYSRRYDLEQLNFELAGKPFSIFHVKDIDPLLEELVKKGQDSEEIKDEKLPYWAELWPSSISLAQFILISEVVKKRMTVLELGCGIGLAGIAAALAGGEVTITDYQAEALAVSEMNWLINLGVSPRTLLMDWRKPFLDEKFDLIIGSDIVYEERFFEPILNIIWQMSTDDGRILLSEPNRPVAVSFFPMLQTTGWKLEKHDSVISHQGRSYNISDYLIEKK